jgi:hypothetical protein
MKIRDKKVKEYVDVAEKECLKFKCYWPRPDPGVFVQGRGYRSRHNDNRKSEWICGTRNIHGCPIHPKIKED